MEELGVRWEFEEEPMRIGIRDLADPIGRLSSPGQFSVPVAIDDDGAGCCGGAVPCGDVAPDPDPTAPSPTGLPTLTIMARRQVFQDEEGTPRYGWAPIVRGIAVISDERRELNDATGQTLVTRSATMGWAQDPKTAPAETAVAQDEDGKRWDITSLQAMPGRLQIKMQRIADAP